MATSTKTRTSRKGAMTDEHKAALAEGREQGLAVRRYLEAIQGQHGKRTRRQSPEVVRARLSKIESELKTASSIVRLQLVQERMDLVEELESPETDDRWRELEEAFVRSARTYSERKGISYAAWREIGVSASVLQKAGIERPSKGL